MGGHLFNAEMIIISTIIVEEKLSKTLLSGNNNMIFTVTVNNFLI